MYDINLDKIYKCLNRAFSLEFCQHSNTIFLYDYYDNNLTYSIDTYAPELKDTANYIGQFIFSVNVGYRYGHTMDIIINTVGYTIPQPPLINIENYLGRIILPNIIEPLTIYLDIHTKEHEYILQKLDTKKVYELIIENCIQSNTLRTITIPINCYQAHIYNIGSGIYCDQMTHIYTTNPNTQLLIDCEYYNKYTCGIDYINKYRIFGNFSKLDILICITNQTTTSTNNGLEHLIDLVTNCDLTSLANINIKYSILTTVNIANKNKIMEYYNQLYEYINTD